MSLTVETMFCLLPFLALYTVVLSLSEIACLSCNKGKELLLHVLIQDDKSLIKLRKETILRINIEIFGGTSFKFTVVI